MPIAKFIYNSVKNNSNRYISSKPNHNFYPYIWFKKNMNPLSKSKLVDQLANKIKFFISVYKKNFYYAQDF